MNDNMRCTVTRCTGFCVSCGDKPPSRNVEYLVWTGKKNLDTILAPSAIEAVKLFSNRYSFGNNQKIFAVPLTDMQMFRVHVQRDVVIKKENS